MSLENWFWGIYVLTLLFGIWANYDAAALPVFYRRGGSFLVLMVLIGIMGYRIFGSVVKN